MEQLKKGLSVRFRVLCALLCLLLCLTLTVGVAWGRYVKQTNEKVTFQPAASDSLELQNVQWQAEDNTYTIQFTVSSSAADQMDYTLSLLASLGIGAAENAAVTLTLDGTTYTGQPEPILEGSTLYTSFGDGWVYRFYDGDTELTGTLQGSEAAGTITITITAPDGIPNSTLFRLVATAAQ